jgi:hypothetical protein
VDGLALGRRDGVLHDRLFHRAGCPMTTPARIEAAVARWLQGRIGDKGAEILDGRVTAEQFNEARAYRRALKDVLAALPDIVKKEADA